MFNDLMENIEWFFNLHDKNKDGFLSKDEVLTLCESLLVSRIPQGSWSISHALRSLFSGLKSGMPTWERSAALCPTLSSMEMLFYLARRERMERKSPHQLNPTNRTSTLLRKLFQALFQTHDH